MTRLALVVILGWVAYANPVLREQIVFRALRISPSRVPWGIPV